MDDENPTQIQWAPEFQGPALTPLVLIHDGGGTTFGYYTLESLNRDVYGIHNPHYYSAEPWKGGMDEMARHYIQLLKNARISGTIFLGGWSLGGYLSLTMARMLAADESSNISIAGLLMIDSPFHASSSKSKTFEESAKADVSGLPDLVRKSLDNCAKMLTVWDLPAWDGAAQDGRKVSVEVSRTAHGRKETVVIPAGHALHKSLRGEVSVISAVSNGANTHDKIADVSVTPDSPETRKSQAPPPAVLLRCAEKAPSSDPTKPARVDLFRDKVMLGWDESYLEFIKAVIDVDSHHYNIFDFSNTEAVTGKMLEALDILDSQKE